MPASTTKKITAFLAWPTMKWPAPGTHQASASVIDGFGRMSGASGKVPAAIHMSPEALPDGPLARVRDGDLIRLDAHNGQLEAVGVDLASRPPANSPPPPVGTGRELFALMRMHVNEAEAGASAMLAAMEAEGA